MKAQCPECEADVELKPSAELGDPVICPECGTQLEVISVKPPELDYALDVDEEDEDDFDDLDEDDEEWEEDEDDELWDDDEDDEDDF